MRSCTLWLMVAVCAGALSSVRAAAWWESTVVYQIYPRSYKDSDGDGVGDLNGIASKLDYLKSLGVNAIWLSPIYKSPMYDFGYDIADYKDIDPIFGTMADFDALLTKANSLGIRIVLDFVPNHTSHQSYWFEQSVFNNNSYKDYYIWANGKTTANGERTVPNNWLSMFGGSAWEYNEVRQQYYLHQFAVQQPDLNYRNAAVVADMQTPYSTASVPTSSRQAEEKSADLNLPTVAKNATPTYEVPHILQVDPTCSNSLAVIDSLNTRLSNSVPQNVLRFWLNKGVSGFRVDAVNFLYEVEATDGVYPDEPVAAGTTAQSTEYGYLNHTYTVDLDETYTVVFDWRTVLDEFIASSGESKIMMTEAYSDIAHMVRYYGDSTRQGSIPFNFIFLQQLSKTSTANDMKSAIDQWMSIMPSGKTANWVNGNHDQSRLATRHGENRVDAMNMLAMLLPGVTITYQGEEIGMTDGYVSYADTKDPQACNTNDPENYASKSRDPERTPFHWDSTAFAGFTNGTSTWLPMASNYQTVNVAVQETATKSHLKFYRDMVALKHSTPVSSGDLTTNALSETVMVVTRTLSDDAVVGVINLAATAQEVDLSSLSKVPQKLVVAASGITCSLEKGVAVEKNKITMPAYCALALKSSAYKITAVSFIVYCVIYVLYAAV